MTLWLILAAMSALAVILVVWPLIGSGRRATSRDAHALEIYRDQLDEVGRDTERGLISAVEAEAARAEIGRRILALDPAKAADGVPGAAAAGDTGNRPAAPRRAPRIAALTAILVPLFAGAVYLVNGDPGLPDLPAADRQVAANSNDSAVRARVATLAAALQKNPNDLSGWVSLGDALTALRHNSKAAVAYHQAMRLAPHDAALASRYGEALTFANGGEVTVPAKTAFENALKLDPTEPRAQYYLGLADRQGGRLHMALKRWLALEASSPPKAPWLGFLRPRIKALADAIGLGDKALADLRAKARAKAGPRPAGPSREQVEATQNMSDSGRLKMIHSMVDRLAARLEKNPDDVNGWLQLGRARTVLGERDKAKAAFAHAAKLKPDNVDVLVAWADSIVDAAKPAAPSVAELKPVVDRILAQKADDPRALWLAGALAVSAGDDDAARRHWTKLLAELEPGSLQYTELKKQLDSLPPAK